MHVCRLTTTTKTLVLSFFKDISKTWEIYHDSISFLFWKKKTNTTRNRNTSDGYKIRNSANNLKRDSNGQVSLTPCCDKLYWVQFDMYIILDINFLPKCCVRTTWKKSNILHLPTSRSAFLCIKKIATNPNNAETTNERFQIKHAYGLLFVMMLLQSRLNKLVIYLKGVTFHWIGFFLSISIYTPNVTKHTTVPRWHIFSPFGGKGGD